MKVKTTTHIMRNFDTLPDSAQLTDKDLAEWMRVSRATVWAYTKDGKLPQPRKFSTRCTRWMCGEVRKALGIGIQAAEHAAA